MSRSVRQATLIIVGCLAALAGLGLARKVHLILPIWPLLLVTFCLLLLRPKNVACLILMAFLGLSLGLWRGGLFMDRLGQLNRLTDQKVTIQATATSDAIYAKQSQIQFTVNHVKLSSPRREALAGNFKISGFGVPIVYRGDRVQISGKLYPSRGANQATIAYAQLRRLGQDDSWLNRLTRRFTAGLQTALPEPQASFGLGLLIGQRTTLPQEILNQLALVGLVHIVAVSGYNVTILARAVARLKLGSKYQQLVLSLTLIAAFVLVTGFSASIVRAALVSLLSLWAWFYGRKVQPVVLIAFAAALTGLLNPFYVWSDLGWYLSFLAFFGVLVIAPIIVKRLFKRQPKNLTMVLVETFSAEVMTLPLIMVSFGQLSLIALVANLLVLPLVPWAMLLATVAGLAGWAAPALAGWLAWPARLLLTYMLDVAHWFANLPAVIVHKTIGLDIMLSFYGLVLVVILIWHHRAGRQASEL